MNTSIANPPATYILNGDGSYMTQQDRMNTIRRLSRVKSLPVSTDRPTRMIVSNVTSMFMTPVKHRCYTSGSVLKPEPHSSSETFCFSFSRLIARSMILSFSSMSKVFIDLRSSETAFSRSGFMPLFFLLIIYPPHKLLHPLQALQYQAQWIILQLICELLLLC